MGFTNSVYPGDPEAPAGSLEREVYVAGADAFSTAGQYGSIFNLFLSFVFMGLGYTSLPNNLIYAPCLFGSAAVCFLCAFVVGHSHTLAFTCFVLSTVGLTAAGSIPYGIVAVWNRAAEEAGHAGSVAMQMAILNCCITVGQQLCTMILGALEGSFPSMTRSRVCTSSVWWPMDWRASPHSSSPLVASLLESLSVRVLLTNPRARKVLSLIDGIF